MQPLFDVTQQHLQIVYRELKNIPGLPWQLEQGGITVPIPNKALLGDISDIRLLLLLHLPFFLSIMFSS